MNVGNQLGILYRYLFNCIIPIELMLLTLNLTLHVIGVLTASLYGCLSSFIFLHTLVPS